MKKYFLSFLIFLICSNTIIAQRSEVDSLLQSIKNSKEDTTKVNALYDLSFSYVNSSPDSVIIYGEQSLQLAKKLNFKKGIANACYALGAGSYRKGEIEKAKTYFLECAAIAKEVNDKALAVKGYLGLGNASLAQAQYDTAIMFFQSGALLSEETGDFGRLATLLNNIGILHHQQQRHWDAVAYFRRSLKIGYSLSDTGNLALAYSNLAMNYKNLDILDTARMFADSAAYFADQIHDIYTKSHATAILGLIDFDLEKYDSALPYLRASYMAFKDKGNNAEMAEILNALGKVHFNKGNIDSSLFYYLNAKDLIEKIGWVTYMRSTYEGLSDCYLLKGDYRNAHFYLQKFIEAQNKYLDTLNVSKVAELNAKYDAVSRQRKIDLLEKDKLIQLANAEREKTIQYFSFGGIALLILFGGMTYHRFRQRVALSKQLADSLNKLKETQNQLIETERMREQEKIRLRVSRDLHDDIGSTLSSINMLSRTAKKRLVEKDDQKLFESLEKIGERTQNTLDNMSDIIWSIKPGNDSLSNVLSRMREYAGTVLEANEIQYTIDFPAVEEGIQIPLTLRNNLFLIFKEAVNNLAKYSKCTQAKIILKIQQNKLRMMIEDNGIGFVPGERSGGNGLINMEKRAEESGGEFELTSSAGKGTSIIFTSSF